ncbi:hypothetical protein H4R35_006807, partial [Dimargaris xerosporica]
GLRKSEQSSLMDLFRQKASASGGGGPTVDSARTLSLTASTKGLAKKASGTGLTSVIDPPLPASLDSRPVPLPPIGPSLSLSAVLPSSQPSQAAGSVLAPGQFAQTPGPSDKHRSASNDGLAKPSKSHINHNLRKFMSGMGNIRKGSNEGKSF